MPDPRSGRFDRLVVAVRAAALTVAALALAAVVLPGTAGVAAGGAAVVLLVAAPLLRVLWFAVRWFRRGDPRFAAVAVGVLATAVLGAVLSR